jgi:hypothetical protein
MEVSDCAYAKANLYPKKRPPIHTGQSAEWVLDALNCELKLEIQSIQPVAQSLYWMS